MTSQLLADIVAGPFLDLRRLLLGALTRPPTTRRLDPEALSAARAMVARAGCDLSRCTEANLHSHRTRLTPGETYDLFAAWKAWPRSSFFPCPGNAPDGTATFAYRFYGLIPIVTMRLASAVRPRHIIHEVLTGFGAGGYHCFLFREGVEPHGGTDVSIFTVFPPQPFLHGLHDQTNRDIFGEVDRAARQGE